MDIGICARAQGKSCYEVGHDSSSGLFLQVAFDGLVGLNFRKRSSSEPCGVIPLFQVACPPRSRCRTKSDPL
ncbi:hypothetical protein PISMIDRAFT_684322, partial [Pisolithus microcarpus 441]